MCVCECVCDLFGINGMVRYDMLFELSADTKRRQATLDEQLGMISLNHSTVANVVAKSSMFVCGPFFPFVCV